MSKQTVNIGAKSNDGTGDNLRVAMDKIQDNTDEVYSKFGDGSDLTISGDVTISAGVVTIANDAVENAMIADDAVDSDQIADDAVDSDHIADGAIDEVHLNVTNSPTDGYVLTYDSATLGFTWEQKFDGDITSIVAGDGLTGSNLGSGDATLNVNVDDSTIEISSDTVQVKDDGITHSKLEDRYTDSASITTLTGTVSFDCSTACNFKLSGDLTGAYTIDLSNYKKGQVVSIWPLKAQSVTLDAQGTSTNTFYKVGGVDYDNTTSSLLQIECVDDSSTDPVFFYSIATYSSDSTI